jgi:hypothetical protein
MGHAISRLLNASNLAMLAAKVNDTVTECKTDCDGLPDRLQLILRNLGVPEADATRCDRVRTAKAVNALLGSCENKDAIGVVGAIARAKLETHATAMGRSLKSAKLLLEGLRHTRWDLFSAVAQIADGRKTDAALLIQDIVGWLKADEYALAGGLLSRLSEAEGRAIRLLTPAKPAEPPPVLPPADLPTPKPGWKRVSSGAKTRLSHRESILEAQALLERLEKNPNLRLTVQWTLEEQMEEDDNLS